MISKMKFNITCLLFIIFLFTTFFTVNISAQKIKVDFSSEQWDKSRAKIVEHLGREALMGTAFLKDVSFTNGTIEVDIATKDKTRSYPAVFFRIKDRANYERIYIRPHRSPFYDDALQCAPVFNGVDSWQLYNGEGKTASLEIPPDTWNHLKIVFAGDKAQIFWNDEETPSLVIEELSYGVSSGTIGLSGPMDNSSFYSNFSYEINEGLKLPPSVPHEPMYGIMDNWQLSEPFALLNADFSKYPAQEYQKTKWQNVKSDRTGLVDVSRYYSRQRRAGDCILAKTIISTDRDTLMRIGFGYSDFISIYLDKKPLFTGFSAYQSRDKSFLGIVGYFDNVYLPLKKGDNELLVMVGESMGGWGFCFRKEDEVFIDKSIEKKWTLKDSLSMPEAVVYDPGTNALYVANYYNEGNEYITKVSLSGKVIKRDWISGLRLCTGMAIDNNKLYAVNRNALIVIDLIKEKVIEKIPLKGMLAPNDITIDNEGTIYISDLPANAVFKLNNGVPEKWVDNLDGPNGLLYENGNILIGQNKRIDIVNIKDKSSKTMAKFESGSNIDGLQSDGNGNYLVSDYNGKLYRVFPDGKKIVLMNTVTPGKQIADFY